MKKSLLLIPALLLVAGSAMANVVIENDAPAKYGTLEVSYLANQTVSKTAPLESGQQTQVPANNLIPTMLVWRNDGRVNLVKTLNPFAQDKCQVHSRSNKAVKLAFNRRGHVASCSHNVNLIAR